MKPWVRTLLIVAVVAAVVFGGYVAFALPSNGNDVNAEIHVGTGADGTMYMRCASVTGAGASCAGGDQMTLTVHKRDRVHLTIVDDQGGGHQHDFNVEGWQYFLWPNSPETELESGRESVTFTTWADGTFHVLCELKGHDAAGMHGTLVVVP